MTDTSAQVAGGGVQISATGGTFAGDADALMDQMTSNLDAEDRGFTVSGGRGTLATDSGLVGVSEPFTSTSGEGLVATFVLPEPASSETKPSTEPDSTSDATTSRAITFVVDTSNDQFAANVAEIDATLRSLTAGGTR